ncbi:hypothetical protein Tco_0987991 [Tanacetum coccineum]|uniref:Integrase, catalytic region, zinc finger, CCHC-type, peptidase aspartic, catalytic n=1 Tax=Tanacetum coccineum TaxID=301880 RepID=A0ABQ5EPX0_9ASTR
MSRRDQHAMNILLQGLPKDIYTLINHYTDTKDIWDSVKMLLEGSELTKDERESQLYDDFEHFRQNKEETIHEYYIRTSSNTRNQATVQNDKVVVQNVQGRQNRGQGNNARGAVAAGNGGFQNRVGNANPEYFKDKMLLMQAQENGLVLDEEQLLFIAADQCDAFESDVDEAPTTQTMFMENLSSADPIYDEAGPSYDSDILSEVQDHDNYLDSVDEYQEVHEMHNDVQQNYVVDSDAEYTSDSNIIPYDQYVKNNAEQVVQSNVSSVPNDALMMIINDMHDQAAQCVSANEQNKVVNESLTVELARYKEQVVIYEKRTRFELTEREQKIDE